MKKSVLIVGMSGVGKTSVSKKLTEMGYKAYDLDSELGLCTMVYKGTETPVVDHDNADLEKVKNIDWIYDKAKLIALITNEPSEIAFYCGSATNTDELLPLFDKVVLLTVEPDAVRHRLTTRSENDFGKTKEVQDWLLESKEEGEMELEAKGAIVINANKDLEAVAKEIVEKVQS